MKWSSLRPSPRSLGSLCRKLGVALCLGALAQQAAAFAFRDAADGISCRHFDIAMGLVWPEGKAAWFDAQGVRNGARAFDSQIIELRGGKPALRWNITSLVQAWGEGRHSNDGLLLAGVGAPGGAQFHSRESPDVGLRPSLQITYLGGASELLSAAADADLDCSTQTGVGVAPFLTVGPQTGTAMRFDLTRLRKGAAKDIKKAELILVRTPVSAFAAGALGVFRLATPFAEAPVSTQAGLAAAYPADKGIEKHPDVLFVDRFEQVQLDPKWTVGDKELRFMFEPMPALPLPATPASSGRPAPPPAIAPYSLRATVPAGKNTGLDLRYDFKLRGQAEPEEAYLRYYLRLGREWRTMGDSGKLPGFAGTYGKAGWGGRSWDGQLGWSARGSFIKAPAVDHPMFGRIALASYVYHSKANAGGYGEIIPWSGGQGAGFIETERWVCVEQFIKLNTPGQEDGVLRAWVDGRLVFERSNFRFRDTQNLKIENAWMDLYYGGSAVSPRNYSMHIDNVVIARRYIGPMAPPAGSP